MKTLADIINPKTGVLRGLKPRDFADDRLIPMKASELRDIHAVVTGAVWLSSNLKPRRPLDDDNPNGYRESDQDFVNNNLEACVSWLEHNT